MLQRLKQGATRLRRGVGDEAKRYAVCPQVFDAGNGIANRLITDEHNTAQIEEDAGKPRHGRQQSRV